MNRLTRLIKPLFFKQGKKIVAFYAACLAAYFILFKHPFLANLETPTWFIAPIMALGSFVAGSTFLGGGAVAFPALTKLMAVEPSTAKTFSLAIQSVGMSAASIYIFSRVKNLPLLFILLFVFGSSLGLTSALCFFEASIPAVDLRIGFTLFLLCFLSMYLFTRRSMNITEETKLEASTRDVFLTLACGFIGGTVSGLLGSGADVLGFSLLVLYFRMDIKRATQISVILMAANAIIGTLIQGLILNRITQEVWSLWYVAAPVVILGAPMGAAFCRRISPKYLIGFICGVVLIELVSTLYLIKIDTSRLPYYGMAALGSIALMMLFHSEAKKKHPK